MYWKVSNIRFLGIGNIRTPLRLGVLHLLVGNLLLGVLLQAINPAVANTVTELLLLAPKDLLGQVRGGLGLVGGVESLADDVLLNALLGDHLLLGVNSHGHLEEFLVQEGHTGLKTPGGSGLVGTQAVSQVQVLDTADSLLVELLLVGGGVEVEVTAENLVATLTTQNHLDTHGLDLAGQQVHGGRGTDGGDIVGLKVVDDVGEGVQTVFNFKGESVVLGAQELGDLLGGLGIGSTRQTDGKGVQLLESGDSREIILLVNTDELGAINTRLSSSAGSLLHAESLALGDGSNQTGVQTTREQNTIGDLSHQTLANGLLQRVTEQLVVNRGRGNLSSIPPLRLVVTGQLVGLGVVDVTGRESNDVVANGVERLELGGEVDSAGSLRRATKVEAGDTNGVTSSNNTVLLLVPEDPGEHAVQVLGRIKAVLHILKSEEISKCPPLHAYIQYFQ